MMQRSEPRWQDVLDAGERSGASVIPGQGCIPLGGAQKCIERLEHGCTTWNESVIEVHHSEDRTPWVCGEWWVWETLGLPEIYVGVAGFLQN